LAKRVEEQPAEQHRHAVRQELRPRGSRHRGRRFEFPRAAPPRAEELAREQQDE